MPIIAMGSSFSSKGSISGTSGDRILEGLETLMGLLLPLAEELGRRLGDMIFLSDRPVWRQEQLPLLVVLLSDAEV